jgi:L-lactate dehydrogenase complex protein LldG
MMTNSVNQPTSDARSAIMTSIREHLAESERREVAHDQLKPAEARDRKPSAIASDVSTDLIKDDASRVAMFRERLEAVGAHSFVARDEVEAAAMLTNIVGRLPATQRLRLTISNAPVIARLVRDLNGEDREIAVTPDSDDLFNFDVGITSAQLAIAETGTLVLESDSERHRLISLVPPVHIAIVEARNIVQTLGDALRHVQSEGTRAMSRAITFITGPSRTADIELTLAIGVHGPKELYVIIVESNTN